MALLGLTRKREDSGQPARVKWLRRLLPYAGTAAILLYLYFHLKDRFVSEEFFDALKGADLTLLLAGTVLPFCIYIVINIAITSRIFTWYVTPLKAGDIWGVRGASLMLNLINPALAGGAWMVYLMRKTGAPILRVMAMAGLNVAAALTGVHIIVTTITALMWTGQYPASEELRMGLTIYTVFGWVWFFQTVTFWLMGWKWGPLNIMREWRINELMRRARLRHWIYVASLVLPSVFAAFIGQYLCALAFHIYVPFHIFIGKFLKVLFYLAIPSVGGVGPLTAGWLKAYEGMASPEAIVACTLALITIGHITRLMLGLLCLIPATREIGRLNEAERAAAPEA